jgi:hypothetical protein
MIFFKQQKFWLTALSLIVSATGIVNLQRNNLNSQLNSQDSKFFAQQEELLKTTIEIQQQLPKLGLGNLIADWNYLQFIQYFGDYEARQATGYSLVTNYFETVLEKDPHFTQAFLSFSTANSLFAARPEKTVEFINQVVESTSAKLPGYPFLLWTYKATDEILFLGDLEAAKHSYEMAAKWARFRKDALGNEMAARYEKTAAFLATKPDPTQAQIGAWVNILSTARDEKTATYVIEQLKNLGVEVSISNDGKLNIKPLKKDV